jgi:hypothetical protein
MNKQQHWTFTIEPLSEDLKDVCFDFSLIHMFLMLGTGQSVVGRDLQMGLNCGVIGFTGSVSWRREKLSLTHTLVLDKQCHPWNDSVSIGLRTSSSASLKAFPKPRRIECLGMRFFVPRLGDAFSSCALGRRRSPAASPKRGPKHKFK